MNTAFQVVDIPVSDDRVTFFREQVAVDWGYPISVIHNELRRNDLPGTEAGEEVFKFSARKWRSCDFDHLLAVIVDDRVVSVSGVRHYGNFLRVGMHYYTLKPYRSQIRSPLWSAGGMLDYLQLVLNGSNLFLTIYPHNSRLVAWVNKLARGQNYGQLGRQPDDILYTFRVHSTPIQFNKVDQYIVYQNGLNPLDIAAIIQDKPDE